MLSAEDNEILVRTGAGTAMGDYFRRYWIPFALARGTPTRSRTPNATRVPGIFYL